jgi:serine/threonine protein kinase
MFPSRPDRSRPGALRELPGWLYPPLVGDTMPRNAMALTSGSRLGPFEIVAVLGAGGMGEVYRAKDTCVGRDVAIKILPA